MSDFINKRVLFLITQSEMGGAQRFLVNLISRLDKSRYEVSVAAGPDGNWEIFDELKKHNIATHKLRHAHRAINPIRDWRAILEIRKLIKEFNPDVLFLNSSKTTVWGPMAVNFPSKIKPTPKIIYRIGGWSFNDPRSSLGKWLWRTLEKYFAKYKDIIIVNNKHDFEQAGQFGIKPKRLELVYNGIDADKLEFFSRNEARGKLGLTNDKLIIGTIANFYPTKGLSFLLKAMSNVKSQMLNIVLVIIGTGKERDNLKLKIKNLKLENNVVLAGQLPDAYKCLPAFDIFVLPSVKEGFPWVVLEAMSAKLPIVATRVGAVPEIIEDGKSGLLVKPGKPEQMAEAIKKLLTNDFLRQELGIRAHQTVLLKFGLDKMVKRIEELL